MPEGADKLNVKAFQVSMSDLSAALKKPIPELKKAIPRLVDSKEVKFDWIYGNGPKKESLEIDNAGLSAFNERKYLRERNKRWQDIADVVALRWFLPIAALTIPIRPAWQRVLSFKDMPFPNISKMG